MVSEIQSNGVVYSPFAIYLVSLRVVLQVAKYISTYGMQIINDNKYPLPFTVIVIFMEVIKVVLTLFRLQGKSPRVLLDCWRFLFPGLLHAINGFIFYYVLTLVSPPILLILASVKIPLTAFIYKFFLGRKITKMQFIGVFFIVLSIVIAKIPSLLHLGEYATPSSGVKISSPVNFFPNLAMVLAFVVAFNSIVAAIYIEYHFKKEKSQYTFLEQQYWLYFFGLLTSIILHYIFRPDYSFENFTTDLKSFKFEVLMLFIVSTSTRSVGGLVIASVLKHLDNVAKEYSGSIANILIAIVCSFAFPEHFQLTLFIGMSFIVLFFGVYFYEAYKSTTKNQDSTTTLLNKSKNNSTNYQIDV